MRLITIQYLRGVAALLIVFYHIFSQLERLGYSGQRPDWLGAGVDIFFVISGFVMWLSTAGRGIGVLEFFRHRTIRIVPLYWIVTTFYLVVLLVAPTWMQSAKFELPHIISSYLFIPHPHPVMAQFMWPLVIPGWTLNYEALFYFLFGIALVFPGRTRVIAIVGTLICLVGLQVTHPPPQSIIAFYSSSIVLEFAFGVVLGCFYAKGFSLPRLPAIALMLLGGYLLVAPVTGLSGFPRAFTAGVPALLIVAGAVFFERSGSLRDFAFPKLLGDASYSLYLTHGAAISAFTQFWRLIRLPGAAEVSIATFYSLVAVTIAIIVAIVVYRFVEQPMIRKISGRKKWPERKAHRSISMSRP